MKHALGVRGRFVIAGALLVAVTAASSAWSAWAFREVSRSVDATLHDSEQTTTATVALATALEREDDALLLTLTDGTRGKKALEADRSAVEDAFVRLDALLTEPDERPISSSLKHDVDAYHQAGDDLVAHAHDTEARLRYHELVNPLLRKAVASAAHIRDDHFRSAQRVATWARDRAVRSTEILTAVTCAALVVSLLIALSLARTIVLPIRALTDIVDAMRRGDFERRVPSRRADELGRLADGFNRMAEDLAAFRRANVGEVIRAKETLEATLAALPDAVVVVAPDGSIASTNPRARSVMRASAQNPAGTLKDLPVPEHAKASLEGVLRGEPPPAVPVVDLSQAITVTVEGRSRKFLPRVVPIEGLPDGRRGAVLVLSDLTELVRLDEMRMELVAVASHELRTPLTTLRMTLLMLQERAARLDERAQELVRTALLGIDQLAAIVDEFLDLTRIEAGQLRLNWDLVDLDAVVQREASMVQDACDEGGVTLVVDSATSAATTVRGDAARLHVVLANILANALKYTRAGGRIVMHAEAKQGSVSIAIEDSGPGVPPEFRERIFEKFFRVEHHREGDAGVHGSGIGLYIAREIVEAHGGALRYEEGGEGGARFVVTLRASPPEP